VTVSNAQVAPGEFKSSLHGVQYLADLAASHQTSYLDDSTWRTYDTEALQAMLPSMVQEVSAVNFLLELKDFRDVVRSSRTGLLAELRKFKRFLRGEDDLRPLSLLSNLTLFNSFAVQPFISDVSKIYKGLFTLRERIRELESRQGTRQTRHYRRTLEGYTETPEFLRQYIPATWYKSPQTHGIRFDSYREYLVVPTYHATVRYTYRLDHVDGIGALDAVLDTLGVRLDPSIIWNAIPFTFIIDWFVNVSSFLERFATDNVGMQVVVDDFCSSVKAHVQYTEKCHHYINPYGGNPLQRGEETIYGQSEALVYERRIARPSILSALRTSGFNGREAVLSAALLGARSGRT
jgi:hypothetical protein